MRLLLATCIEKVETVRNGYKLCPRQWCGKDDEEDTAREKLRKILRPILPCDKKPHTTASLEDETFVPIDEMCWRIEVCFQHATLRGKELAICSPLSQMSGESNRNPMKLGLRVPF